MLNRTNILAISCFLLSFLFIVLSQNVSEVTEVSPEDENSTTAADLINVQDELELKNQDHDVWCKLQPNGNSCSNRAKLTRYYYDVGLEDCKTFLYGHCSSAYNNFGTLSECHDYCRENGLRPLRKKNITDKIICRLQSSFGHGYEYNPRFYFDINRRKCRGFSYSGVGGNANRFPNSQTCTTTCLRLMDAELGFK